MIYSGNVTTANYPLFPNYAPGNLQGPSFDSGQERLCRSLRALAPLRGLTLEPSASFNYEKRFSDLQGKLRDFEERIALGKKVNFAIRSFTGSAYARFDRNEIKLPSWCLFKPEDIPPCYRISDVNDPRLDDDVFLNTFGVWITDTLLRAGLKGIKLCRDSFVCEKWFCCYATENFMKKRKILF